MIGWSGVLERSAVVTWTAPAGVNAFIVGLPRPYGLGINITIAFTTAS